MNARSPDAPMAGLELADLKKSFGGNPVVRGLSLTIERGEIVALLGPSGCGKTTALRMIAGLERPDAGEIRIHGRTVFGPGGELPPEVRGLGMVFQSYAVWPHKSVRDNVAFPLLLRRDPEARARAEAALATVRLAGFGDRLPHTLSGGQQQRVALARALVARPDLLLFDEPLSNLDAQLREEMRHEIRALTKAAGLTALYVTHDQAEAFAVSDRIAVVLEGRVAEIAAPEALYAEPATLEAARFVGRLSTLAPVTLLEGPAVQLGAQRIPVSVAPGIDADTERVLAVRPEDLALASAGEPALPAEIVRASFLGDRRELVLATAHGELRADVPPSPRLAPGARVGLRVLRGRVFAARRA
jgi:iron(III) transport system ATP-binding protein